MAYFSETQLPRYREDDMPGTVKKLYNFCRELQEMLQFVLSNLDADNIEGYEEIFNRLADADGNLSILRQTAEEIFMQVRQGEGKLAELTVRADGITQRVQDTEKGIAEIRVTADGISQRVADNAGNISSLRQTANGLASQVAGVRGSLSSVEQTSEEIRQAVYGKNGNGATTSVTANGLLYEVFGEDGKFSRLAQTVEGIDITGAVTFNDLKGSGKSVINGDNITTGTVALERLELENSYGGVTFQNGSTGDYATKGAMLYGGRYAGSAQSNYVIATTSGCRMTSGPTHLAVWAGEIYASIPISDTSDERLKNTISYDVAERYGAFFRALKPARFHRNDGTSGRFHTGFIAQQMRDALAESGLSRQDLAALVQQGYDPDQADGGGGRYSIRYSELVSLNTAMVQQLLGRVDALEAEVKALKGGA